MIHPKHLFTLLVFIFSCHTLQGQNFDMDGTPITSCTGYFHDSGGAAAPYSIDENLTTTICSDGTEGTHIQLLFSGIDIGEGDSIRIYDAPTADVAFQFDNGFLIAPENPFIIQATAANPSGCITIVFTSNNIDDGNTGWNASISCIPSCQTIEATLIASTPVVSPVDTGWIDICPGDEVFFQGSGVFPQNNISYIQDNSLSTFEWDFGDGSRGVGPMVNHVYPESGGYIVQLTITDQEGCTSTNFLNQRVRVSTAPTFELEGIRDSIICTDETIDLSSGVDALLNPDLLAQANTGFFNPTTSRPDTIKLPDGVGTSYQSSLYFTQFPAGAVLENVDDLLGVLLNIEHSYYGDLSIELICPDGTSVSLLTRDNAAPLGSTNLGEPWAAAATDTQSGDSTQGCGYDYTFVNNSANGTLRDVVASLPTEQLTTKPSTETGTIHQYLDRTFPAGVYQSDTVFDSFIGCPLNGQWTIKITDHLAQDNGWLFNWALMFPDHLFTNIETFTPVYTTYDWETNPTVTSSTPESISATPTSPGPAQFTFWVLDTFGCQYDTTIVYEVLPLTHPQCLNCNIEINEESDILQCQGEIIQLDVSPTAALEECIEFEQFPQYEIGAANHPVGTPYGSVFNVNSMNPTIISNPIQDICSVCVDLSTDNLSDITLILEAPNGTQVLLSEMNGGNSPLGYVQTCFSPTALMEFSQGAPPYSGSFQPQDANGWTNLVNSPINGQWTLWVTDCCDLTQTGELINWSISFNHVNEYTYSWAPSPNLSCIDCDNPILTVATTEDQILTVTDITGCELIDTISVQLIEDIQAPVVSCMPQNNGILFEWTAPATITEFEYRVIINDVPQMWTGPLSENMLFVDNLNHNDNACVEVRAFLANPPVDCTVEVGSSCCPVTICDLVLGMPIISDASCFNIDDGSISIQVEAGTEPYTYQISSDNIDYTTPMISGLAAGAYSYTVINGDGCDLTQDFVINSPDSLFIDGTQTFAACFGTPENEATAIPGGGSSMGYSITWSNNQTGDNPGLLAAGEYQIQVVDSDGCTATNTISINSLDSITFNFLTDPPTCFGLNDGGVGINQISGGAGLSEDDYTYVWEDGTTDIVRTQLFGGMDYCVTVTDNQGCQAELCRLLTQPTTIPIVLEGNSPSCKGDEDGQISIIEPSPLDSYNIEWSSNTGGQSTETAIDLSSGTYSVTITNSDGCAGENSFLLNDPPPLSSSFIVENNDCYDYSQGSILSNPNGGMAPYHFQWSNGAPDDSLAMNLIAGTYNLTITDSNDCSIEESFMISQPDEVTVDIQETDATCFGDHDGRLEITVDGGSPPFQYSVNGGNFSASSVVLGLTSGDYSIQISDANDCRLFTSAVVNEPAEFTIDAGPDTHINYGDSIQLSSTSNNAQGSLIYFWEEPYDGTLSCLACPEPFASPEHTLDYHLVAIDNEGCEAEDQLRIFVDKSYIVEVPTGFTPNGDSVNDLLLVHGTPGVYVLSFQVFDRWGEEVYFAENFDVNSTVVGWDGKTKDQSFNSEVFVWQLEVLYPDGKIDGLHGQTTLIR